VNKASARSASQTVQNQKQPKSTLFTQISKINGPQRTMTILKMDTTENHVIIAGDNGLVQTYSLESKELIDSWNVGSMVTAIAAVQDEDGGFTMAAGTAEGKMLLRLDWDERTRSEDCGNSYLNDIKFSHDA